ncbi:hypothetical protein GFL38_06390 [Rhizobium leguminosarum bv. viciae]|uniref:sensor histidine kinase n=1 Tax=Rhizobium ruizarguesonis TaxID=2081791 RepID=UPI00143F40B5|nr:sensor histidine kinase [Rhizobium ruizarguesonis]NKJ71917.1 hypothetical protein [Rhizobium leguminosarum bv. viciae]NKQ74099.1 hypothetical protein [Rhizobium ruizarguesonis]NKQ76747.1 hypothetical protein [Rhizobium ruizarguesonis]
MSESQDLRERALLRIASGIRASQVVMWLVDDDEETAHCRVSYATGVPKTVQQRLAGQKFACVPEEMLVDGWLNPEYARGVTDALDQAGLPASEFRIYPFGIELFPFVAGPDGKHRPLTGVVAIKTLHQVKKWIERELNVLALSVALDRDRRVVEAVNRTQQLLDQMVGNVDTTLTAVGSLVRDLIHAKSVVYKNRSAKSQWFEYTGDGRSQEVDVQYANESALHVINTSGHIAQNDGPQRRVEILSVPLAQDAWSLHQQKFVPLSAFPNQLTKMKKNQVTLLFIEKRKAKYLQHRFTRTDIEIARSVFGYIDHYASARIFEENASNVSNYLELMSDEDALQPENILTVLKTLSASFSKVFLLVAEYEDDVIQIDTLPKNDDEPSPGYTERLKSGYLRSFLQKLRPDQTEHIFVGIDPIPDDKGFNIEVHFPGGSGISKIFVLSYEDKTITASVVQSLRHLFSELHVRAKKLDNNNERATYLMQLRHAVVHHFSAAETGMSVLRKLWERGRKNRSRWNDLLADPIAPTTLDRATWSLSQSRLILENGRFLLGEIKPTSLNRKPYRVIELIKECLYTLDDQRQSKGIRIISKINGHPPPIMNADEPLLRIAFVNLIDNAIKYSPHNAYLHWTLTYKSDSYRFEITSAGNRITKGGLFQVGVRGRQRDHLNQRHGTGLGLPVAYKILKAHSDRATLDFRSDAYDVALEDSANTFFFEMPYLTGTTRDQPNSSQPA